VLRQYRCQTTHIDALCGSERRDSTELARPIRVLRSRSAFTLHDRGTRAFASCRPSELAGWRMSPAEPRIARRAQPRAATTRLMSAKWNLYGHQHSPIRARRRATNALVPRPIAKDRWGKWLGFEMRNQPFVPTNIRDGTIRAGRGSTATRPTDSRLGDGPPGDARSGPARSDCVISVSRPTTASRLQRRSPSAGGRQRYRLPTGFGRSNVCLSRNHCFCAWLLVLDFDDAVRGP